MKTAAILVAVSLAGVVAASAHEWYPIACCSGIDCGPAAEGEIEFTPNGWLVTPTGETIAFDRAQVSPDGRFHRCTMIPNDPTSGTRCLFVPAQGS